MKNQLYQQAREFVSQAQFSKKAEDISKAKNSLSSAFANSTLAEQEQLRGMQEQISHLEESL
ncbi:DUF3813 domain-containing protein [Jeotgalibacillus campisalis]|uniref:DUF3813 domain-containing protein n=1 Tax=Jeotgalibacillus campisalis TaxID=220754 RepID=A0A0C2VSP3_9BACL|nr:DUF3813 domain-containing protein [Jeotgalibacillus campisalis]KIL47451.1 hypothetical protein KR50_16180 [Jeotgalibacillus campisalis]